MALMDRLLKIQTLKHGSVLSESELFNDIDVIKTDYPLFNVALSGSLDGGLTSGITFLCGPSKHFKSMLGLMLVKSYFEKYPESICMFYDSEFGITKEYLSSVGIDPNRVIHQPIMNMEELKFDIMAKLEEINRGEKIIIFIDSIGGLASKKEVEDALEEKAAADMTRAKQFKGLWRMLTPILPLKNIPLIAINHSYKEISLFPKDIMSGGTGGMLAANTVFMISKSQEKEGNEIVGWNFSLNIEKSRYVKEKSKIPFLVTYEGGLNKWSGFLDLCIESGFIIKPSNGWYQKVDRSTGEVIGSKIREDATYTKEFMEPILTDPDFKAFIEKKFKVSKLISHDSTV
jgi:hypothetical protein